MPLQCKTHEEDRLKLFPIHGAHDDAVLQGYPAVRQREGLKQLGVFERRSGSGGEPATKGSKYHLSKVQSWQDDLADEKPLSIERNSVVLIQEIAT